MTGRWDRRYRKIEKGNQAFPVYGCCDYYRERFRLYCGGTPEEQEDRLEQELLKFLESAFTFEQSEIVHRT